MLKTNCVGHFFPTNGVPLRPSLANQTFAFFNTDIESRQIDTGYNAEIEYVFNKQGYRSADLYERGEVNVLAIGCSVTFGVGIPAQRRFASVFCSQLSQATGKKVADWNMAMPGESIDYIARVAALSIPVLKPDILLTNLPSLARREFFDQRGNRFDYRPQRTIQDLVEKDIMDKLSGLSSYYDDLARFFINFKLIEGIVKENGCKWLYALQKCDLKQYAAIASHCQEHLRVQSLHKIDLARDNGHPGVNTNFQHGLNYYEKYVEIFI